MGALAAFVHADASVMERAANVDHGVSRGRHLNDARQTLRRSRATPVDDHLLPSGHVKMEDLVGRVRKQGRTDEGHVAGAL